MELDNEVKGEGNSYDFGGRSIYDGRVARFISLDPRIREFPWMSPYAYGANNPVFFIDENGEGPDPPKKNIYILLPHGGISDEIVKNTIEANNKNPNSQFYVISAKSLQDASIQLKNYVGDNKIENIVIATHGPGGDKALSYINTGTEKIGAKELSAYKYNSKRLKEPSSNLITGDDFTGLGWTQSKVKETEALFNIGNSIIKDGKFVITACGGGNDNRFGEYLSELLSSEVTIYLNGDNSQVSFLKEIAHIQRKLRDGIVIKEETIVTREAQINLDNYLRTRPPIEGWKVIRNRKAEKIKEGNVIKLNNSDMKKDAVEEVPFKPKKEKNDG